MAVHFGDFELDPDLQELRQAGAPVHVEPQVFDLLAYLVHHRDRVVSRDELMQAIWGGRIVSDAALSSRILAARRALGDRGPEQTYIRTVPKRGFRFAAEVRTAEAAGPQSAGTSIPKPAPGFDRPALAVMPFVNLGQDPEQDYFAYGITEDIIRLLARNRWLAVVGRNSTMSLKGLELDAPTIGRSLGVDYLVQGTVRRAEGRGRITAELVDAHDGTTLWAERFDFALGAVFDVQDELAQKIAATIEPELSAHEQRSAARKPPGNLLAWECYQRGLWHFWSFTAHGFDEAEEWYRRAVALEPELARAHAAVAYVNVQRAFYDPPRRAESLRIAHEAAREAVRLDPRDCVCHCVLGRVQTLLLDYDTALASLEESIASNPSFAQGYFALGFTLIWSGRPEEALPHFDRAIELSPRDPHAWTFHSTRALALMALDRLPEAEEAARFATRHATATHWPHATLVACLGLQGKAEAAAQALAELLRRKPDYSRAHAREDLFFCRRTDFVDRFVAGLEAAGLA
jgi:TolB-like protein/Flp pilus assembly protein TadD